MSLSRVMFFQVGIRIQPSLVWRTCHLLIVLQLAPQHSQDFHPENKKRGRRPQDCTLNHPAKALEKSGSIIYQAVDSRKQNSLLWVSND